MAEPQKVVLDTNILLDNLEVLEEYDEFVLPITVLRELDKHKTSRDLGYAAREAIRTLRKLLKEGEKEFTFDPVVDKELTNDENIIASAKRNGASLITRDIALSFLSLYSDVECEVKDDGFDVEQFDPYVFDDSPDFPFRSNDLTGDDLQEFITYFENKFNRKLEPWMFYITNGKQLFCYNPKKEALECVTSKSQYQEITVDEGVEFKPKDIYQKAAAYSIMNADATLLLGKFGSGKSLVSTAVSLAKSGGRKAFVIRPTVKSSRYDIGFLPGDKADKLYEFFSGYMSALSFLYGNTRTTNGHGGGYDFVKEDLSLQKFEFLSMNELHGLSVQAGDVIIADEAQLFDRSYMQLLLSRICDGAKLVIMGDLNQTYSLLHKAESGLYSLLKAIPHRGISVVELKNIYRNRELADLAEQIVK